MKATLLDTLTGETATRDDIRSWEWAENGFSCDCNRASSFGRFECRGVCDGCHRYLVVAAEFVEGDYDYTLAELNSGYPQELLRAFRITTK